MVILFLPLFLYCLRQFALSFTANAEYTNQYKKLVIIVIFIEHLSYVLSFNPNNELQWKYYYYLLFIEEETEAELIQDNIAIW